MLRHADRQPRLLQQGPQLRQGFHSGQGDHHHAGGPEPLQHSRQQRRPLAAATADQHAIRIGQRRQVLRSTALQHTRGLHPQPLGISGDQAR